MKDWSACPNFNIAKHAKLQPSQPQRIIILKCLRMREFAGGKILLNYKNKNLYFTTFEFSHSKELKFIY